MLPLKRILFPVDFSDRCRYMLRGVQLLAEQFNAHVTLFHAYQWMYGEFPQEQRLAAESSLVQFLPPGFGSIKTRTVVQECGGRSGNGTAECILNYARRDDSDLIMMPTHGHRLIPQLLLGSVTAKVLEEADCPVWTDSHMDRPSSEEGGRVVCAVDLSDQPAAGRVLRTAREWAEARRAQLVAVHAVSSVAAYVGGGMPFWGDPERASRESMTDLLKIAGVSAEIVVGVGEPAGIVEQTAAARQADLVIVGRGRPGRVGVSRFGSVAYSIVRHAPCPVLSV